MTTKKQVLEKWETIAKTAQQLWGAQARSNASIIKKNSTKKSIEILKKDYTKYENMGIASYIQSAITDLEEANN